MPALVGGVAGAAARIGGGLSSSALRAVEVSPTAPQTVRPSIGTKDGPTLGRFRRHLNGQVLDTLQVALAGATVLVFDWNTKALVGALTSDANGRYDLPLYVEGTTYFLYTNKAGSPELFGSTSNQIVPV